MEYIKKMTQPKKVLNSDISGKKEAVYGSLREWDTLRGSTLARHCSIIKEIIETLEQKIKHSQNYLNLVEALMRARLLQIVSLL